MDNSVEGLGVIFGVVCGLEGLSGGHGFVIAYLDAGCVALYIFRKDHDVWCHHSLETSTQIIDVML